MTNVFSVMLLFTFCIFLVMLAANWFLNFYMKLYIGRRHRMLEELTNSRQVPQEWMNKFERKVRAAKRAGNSEQANRLQEMCRQYCLRQLEQLEGYIQKTKLVDNEETRTILLEELDDIKRQWRESWNHEYA